jgi:signal transduction histidine kinase
VVFPEAECRAQVVVEDHGFGIDSKQLPRIFDRFYRGDPSRNPTTRGFGLGLAIVKALLESYGGTIIAESVQGKGTRMTVSLPVESASPNRNIAVY